LFQHKRKKRTTKENKKFEKSGEIRRRMNKGKPKLWGWLAVYWGATRQDRGKVITLEGENNLYGSA